MPCWFTWLAKIASWRYSESGHSEKVGEAFWRQQVSKILSEFQRVILQKPCQNDQRDR
jgi:hypothetical protein